MPKTPTPDDDAVIRPFADALLELSGGRTHDELSAQLHELIARVRDTGKKGSLTLTVTVSRMKNAAENTLTVTDDVKAKLPAHDRNVSVFYADANGNLTRRDPNQLEFDSLREVPAPPTVIDPKAQAKA
jgi:hypothetical protein